MSYFSQVGREIKEFAVKGNVIDLAVGVIIGGAFGRVVSSLVNDIIMPPIAAITKGIDFTKWQVVLRHGTDGVGGVALKYGQFIQNIIEFIIVALSIFLMVKGINRLRHKREEEQQLKESPKPSQEVQLLIEIRDLLKK